MFRLFFLSQSVALLVRWLRINVWFFMTIINELPPFLILFIVIYRDHFSLLLLLDILTLLFFVDDFSRFTRFYPLRRKFNFYDVLLQFKTFVKNQFSRSIKNFQSDNGIEFTSNKVQALFASFGVLHWISWPHTQAWNGRVERKHKHVLGIGLAMMYHLHVPTSYWVDDFSYAVYDLRLMILMKMVVEKPARRHDFTFSFRAFPLMIPDVGHGRIDQQRNDFIILFYNFPKIHRLHQVNLHFDSPYIDRSFLQQRLEVQLVRNLIQHPCSQVRKKMTQDTHLLVFCV